MNNVENSYSEKKVYYTTEELLQAIEDFDSNKITKVQAFTMVKNLIKNEGAGGRTTPFIKAINLISETKDRDIEERKRKLKENTPLYNKTSGVESTIPKKIFSMLNFGKKIIKEVTTIASKRR